MEPERVRKYAFACTSCKRRKIKCDGLKPRCTGCQRYDERCESTSSRSRRSASPAHRPQATNTYLSPSPRARPIPIPPAPQMTSATSNPSPADTDRLVRSSSTQHYGPTSLLHSESLRSGEAVVPQDDSPTPSLAFRANANLVRQWETLAFSSLEQSGPTAEVAYSLLETYWCWQHPQHMAVYRPAFVRDMHRKGPYYSPFLLNVIYGHAVRLAYPRGRVVYTSPTGEPVDEAHFIAKAKLLLMAEMDRPTAIPTIQGLIILGGRECAIGNASSGWLYTGMALRMMKDIGIHLDSERYAAYRRLSPEDKEVRRNLWWSAYTWDKSISLALGRGPTWHEYEGKAPGYLQDDSSDDNLWTPYFGQEATPIELVDYPPHQSYTVMNFTWLSKLWKIIDIILLKIYVGDSTRNISSLDTIERCLQDWWTSLPHQIKLDTTALPLHCPPPHILSLNLLYRTTWILLHKPFLLRPITNHGAVDSGTRQVSVRSREACRNAVEEIHELLLLHGRTFAFRNMIYIVSYCVFLAATVNVIEIKSSVPIRSHSATKRLEVNLQILENATFKMQGLSSNEPGSPTDVLRGNHYDILDERNYSGDLFQQYTNFGDLPMFPAQDPWFQMGGTGYTATGDSIPAMQPSSVNAWDQILNEFMAGDNSQAGPSNYGATL